MTLGERARAWGFATLSLMASVQLSPRTGHAQMRDGQREATIVALFPMVVRVEGLALDGDDAILADQRHMTQTMREAIAEAERGLHVDVLASIESATRTGDASAGLLATQTLEQLRPRSWVAAQQSCFFLTMQRRFGDALASCARAVRLDERPETYLSLALTRYAAGSETDVHEAERTLQTLTTRFSPALTATAVRCFMALDIVTSRDTGHANLVECAEQMQARAPNSPSAHVYNMWAALAAGDHSAAQRHLEAFERANTSPTDRAKLRGAFEQNRPWWNKALSIAGRVSALWFGLLALVWLWTRDRATRRLRELEAVSSTRDPAPDAPRGYARAVLAIATTYKVVLASAAIAFCALVGAATLWVLSRVNQIPINVLLGVVLFAGAICWVAAGGITGSPAVDHSGEPLVLRDHPALEALLARCASAAGTARIEEVYLTTATNLEVYTTASISTIVHRTPPLYLRLGVGLLDALDRAQLEALVLAELARAQRVENNGGAAVLQVIDALVAHEQRGSVGLLFTAMRHRFRLSALGLSRAQEVIADRIAAKAVGATLFESALRAFVQHNETFFARRDAVLQRCRDHSERLTDLYAQARESTIDDEAARAQIDAEWNRTVSDVASQLSPRARVERVHAYGFAEPASSDARTSEDCWGLFVAPERLRERCTAVVRQEYAQRTGVVLEDGASKREPIEPPSARAEADSGQADG